LSETSIVSADTELGTKRSKATTKPQYDVTCGSLEFGARARPVAVKVVAAVRAPADSLVLVVMVVAPVS
jgi:hypothetical protein